ncbi:MAG: hypothetical protein BroJett030_06610 [Alphaproteobacteria bacterium]|nr:MAG: hypothetical protein BroJett030_06610 [Alphaproteobacteria bacterium]
MTYDWEKYGDAVDARLKQVGYTYYQLAQLAEVEPHYVSSVVCGQSKPGRQLAEVIERRLGVSVDSFVATKQPTNRRPANDNVHNLDDYRKR